MQRDFTEIKIFQKVLGGLLFSETVYLKICPLVRSAASNFYFETPSISPKLMEIGT